MEDNLVERIEKLMRDLEYEIDDEQIALFNEVIARIRLSEGFRLRTVESIKGFDVKVFTRTCSDSEVTEIVYYMEHQHEKGN